MTLRIQQPQIHPDWPWEEVATTDDDESVLENKNGQHHGCDRSGSLWGVVPLFKLSSGQQKSLRARPRPSVPSSQNLWTVQDSANTGFISNMVEKMKVLLGSHHFI